MGADKQAQEDEDGAKLSINQKVHFLWEDRKRLHELLDEHDQRRHHAEWIAKQRSGIWRVVLAAGFLLGVAVSLKGLGAFDSFHALLRP